MSVVSVPEEENIAKGSFVVYLERAVVLALSFVTSVLLARNLSETDYGVYRLAISLLTICTYLVGFGLESVVHRYVPEFLATEKERFAGLTIVLAVGARALSIGVLLIAMFALRGDLSATFGTGPLFEVQFLSVAGFLLFRLIGSALGKAILTAFGDRHVAGYITIAGHSILTVLLAAAVLLGNGLGHVLLALSLAAGFEFVLFSLSISPRVLMATRKRQSQEAQTGTRIGSIPLRRMFSFGLYNFLWQGGQVFREYAVDSYVIALFLDPASVAVYGIAIVIPQLMRSFSPGRMLSGVLMPAFVSRYTQEQGTEGTRRYFILLQKVNAFVYLPMMGLFALTANRLLPLVYGEAYARSVSAALILIVLSVAQSIADPYFFLSQVLEKPEFVFYSSIWGVVNLGLAILLVPRIGIEGAAIATGASGILALSYFLTIYRVRVGAGYGLPLGAMASIFLNSIPLLVVVGLARDLEVLDPRFLGAAVFGILSYLLMTRVNTIFSREEIDLLERITPLAAFLG